MIIFNYIALLMNPWIVRIRPLRSSSTCTRRLIILLMEKRLKSSTWAGCCQAFVCTLKKIDAQGYKGYSCRFWQALEYTGIRRTDPRLQDMVNSMNEINREKFHVIRSDNIELNKSQFKRYLCRNRFKSVHQVW